MSKEEEIKDSVNPTIPVGIPELNERASDVLLLYYKSKLSLTSIADIFSMDKCEVEQTISKFAEQFSTENNLMNVVDALAKMKMKSNVKRQDEQSPETTQAAEIASLRRQLAEARIKAEAYQEMIRLAEQIYNIPIRKKFGAK